MLLGQFLLTVIEIRKLINKPLRYFLFKTATSLLKRTLERTKVKVLSIS